VKTPCAVRMREIPIMAGYITFSIMANLRSGTIRAGCRPGPARGSDVVPRERRDAAGG
jgi:hypothetical protein